MTTPAKITYLRQGRTVRAQGTILETDTRTGMFKVKPTRDDWKTIWITVRELQNGRERASTAQSTPAPAHHLQIVSRMVDGLRQLLQRKEEAA